MIAFPLVSLLAIAFSFAPLSASAQFQKRQAPNTIYQGNELVQTASWNKTDFIVPISKAEAQRIAGNFALLEPEGFPAGFFGADEHPLFITTGLQADIRQVGLRVDRLLTASVYLPFVDAIGTGKPFSKQVAVYANQLIPSLVSSLLYLNNQQIADFDPSDAAYRAIGNEVGVTISQGLKNPIDGPGLLLPRFQGHWNLSSTSTIPASTFHAISAQPYTKPVFDGLCGSNEFFYEETFANPAFAQGVVQLYDPILSQPQVFENAMGYTVVSEWKAESGPGKACTSFT